ncbi:MAG: tRNA uridine-5-carboxymethylaminomethyl(34) synthesis GTPase MnmE [Nitrospiria bacterium]
MNRNFGEDDTICAISTPPGRSGIGIVRVSGKHALSMVSPLFRGPKPLSSVNSHTIHHGKVQDPAVNQVIDEAIFLVMKGPRSYTGEDIVEIQSHGNPYILKKIITLLLHQGARLAGPGEFTRRAFLSGRIDLTQAEAVMELISSRSASQHRWAMSQLKGRLSEKIDHLRGQLISIIAQIEAAIDFSEEDLPLSSPEALAKRIDAVRQEILALLSGYETGKKHREGFTVVIVGRPNVGKSSLLNLFLQEDRAIVTPFPGTTRDLLQETIDLDGIPITLIDTAGDREASNAIEQEGVRRGTAAQKDADIALWLLDASESLSKDDLRLADRLRGVPMIIILNKIDLPRKLRMDRLAGDLLKIPALNLSVKTGEGFEKLQESLRNRLLTFPEKELHLVGLLRHKKALEVSEIRLAQALSSIEEGLSWEFPAIDLREALGALGEITGETTVDEILDEIFNQFCIGK